MFEHINGAIDCTQSRLPELDYPATFRLYDPLACAYLPHISTLLCAQNE